MPWSPNNGIGTPTPYTPQKFEQQPPLNTGPTSPFDDDGEGAGWWSTAQNMFSVAIATAILAATPLVPSFSSQGSASSLVTDEDFWQNPVRPVPLSFSYPQQFQFDQSETVPTVVTFQPDEDYYAVQIPPPPQSLIPTFSQQGAATQLVTDEDYWQNQVNPVPLSLSYPQQFNFDQSEIVPAAITFSPDEDYYSALIRTPSSSPPLQAFSDDDVLPNLHTDEDFWTNPVAPIQATFSYPQPWIFEQNEQAFGLYGQPDEDFWINPVSPISLSFTVPQPWIFDVQEPAGSLYGVPDDGYWLNLVSYPWSTPPFALSSDEVIVPQVSAFNLDEDYWQSTVVLPASHSSYSSIYANDEITQPPIENEDYWLNPTIWPLFSPRAFIDDEVIVTQVVTVVPDEDYWTPGTIWPAYPASRLVFDDELPAGSLFGQPDEDFWTNPVTSAQLAFQIPQPWIFEQNEPGSLYGQPEEGYWQNQVSPVASTFAVQPPNFNDEIAVLFIDEDYWQLPVTGPFTPIPRIFTDDDVVTQIPGFVPDEDFWLNFVAPLGLAFPPFYPLFEESEMVPQPPPPIIQPTSILRWAHGSRIIPVYNPG